MRSITGDKAMFTFGPWAWSRPIFGSTNTGVLNKKSKKSGDCRGQLLNKKPLSKLYLGVFAMIFL
jgi:hypothetical protein